MSCPANTQCASYSCNGTSSCAASYAGSGTGCNDGNACTYNDVCNGAGTCAGTAVSCPADTNCTFYTCNGGPTCTTNYQPQFTVCGTCTCGDRECNGSGTCGPVGCHALPCP